jgi:hypothetical protein
MSLEKGDYVQVRRRIPPFIRGGTRGTVIRIDGDWVTVEMPLGGPSFGAHVDNLTRIVRAKDTKEAVLV